MLTRLPAELTELFAPGAWGQAVVAARDGLLASPLLAVALVAIAVLLSQRRRIRDRLLATGKSVGKISTDGFPLTAQALGWTALLALGFPALLAVTGAAILNPPLPVPTTVIGQTLLDRPLTGTSITRSIGIAVQALALPLFILMGFRLLCLPGGVSQVHLHWTAATCRLLRHSIALLIATVLPAAFLAIMVLRHESLRDSSGLGVLIFAVISLSWSAFFYGVLHPSTGVVKNHLQEHPRALLARTRYVKPFLRVWVPVSLPFVLAVA